MDGTRALRTSEARAWHHAGKNCLARLPPFTVMRRKGEAIICPVYWHVQLAWKCPWIYNLAPWDTGCVVHVTEWSRFCKTKCWLLSGELVSVVMTACKTLYWEKYRLTADITTSAELTIHRECIIPEAQEKKTQNHLDPENHLKKYRARS